jgi:hypothetical protein
MFRLCRLGLCYYKNGKFEVCLSALFTVVPKSFKFSLLATDSVILDHAVQSASADNSWQMTRRINYSGVPTATKFVSIIKSYHILKYVLLIVHEKYNNFSNADINKPKLKTWWKKKSHLSDFQLQNCNYYILKGLRKKRNSTIQVLSFKIW